MVSLFVSLSDKKHLNHMSDPLRFAKTYRHTHTHQLTHIIYLSPPWPKQYHLSCALANNNNGVPMLRTSGTIALADNNDDDNLLGGRNVHFTCATSFTVFALVDVCNMFMCILCISGIRYQNKQIVYRRHRRCI